MRRSWPSYLYLVCFVVIGGAFLGTQAEDAIHNGGFYDYIIVGSGPGGSSVARILTQDPKVSVLMLEAGEDRSTDPPIELSENAWIVPTEYIPQYLWQCMQTHNDIVLGDGDRRLTEEERNEEADGGPVRRRLHGGGGGALEEEYTSGRLMGGGTSINGEQYVWPTKRLLGTLQEVVGGDPDWGPEHVYGVLKELEDFHGESQNPEKRGDSGPLSIISEPEDLEASGMLQPFVEAMQEVNPSIDLVEDYNDPDYPISTFERYQLTQNPDGTRASAATALLPQEVRDRKNFHIKTRATAMYIKFRGNVAKGVYYSHNGIGKIAYARKKVIVAAGHRSSLLLENSGVGNPAIIQPLLESVGFNMVAEVPGIGENLGNDGYVTINIGRDGSSIDENRNDLYMGGAFWPYPGGLRADRQSDRFSQIFGADLVDEDTLVFSIFAGMLNVSSRGAAHIQSPDPLYEPLVSTATLSTEEDRDNWLRMLREQVKPIYEAMVEINPDFELVTDIPWDDPPGEDADIKLLEWVIKNYLHGHHWFGTNSMKPFEEGGVVDSSGHVYGTKNLVVADVSIFPIKADGNTGTIGYIIGQIIGRKLVKEDKLNRGDDNHDLEL